MADDDPDDHEFFKFALSTVSDTNQNFTSFYTGYHLMDYLLKRGGYQLQKHPTPDFIVLDLNMPVEDGFSVLKQIKTSKELRAIKVFVLTVSHDSDQSTKCRSLGCDGFYIKPIKVQELKSMVEEMIRTAEVKAIS
jgi:CheY-like chemotaxis protein